MQERNDARLWAYAAGALDPGRSREIEEALSEDAGLRAEVAAMTAELSHDVRPAREIRRIPPPGFRSPFGFQVESRTAARMGPELKPGDRFEARIAQVADAGRYKVAVLYRGGSGWRVVFPESASDEIGLADLPAADGGGHKLDLVAQPDEGIQRWAIALYRDDLPVRWGEVESERWRPLLEAIEAGILHIASIDVEVG